MDFVGTPDVCRSRYPCTVPGATVLFYLCAIFAQGVAGKDSLGFESGQRLQRFHLRHTCSNVLALWLETVRLGQVSPCSSNDLLQV